MGDGVQIKSGQKFVVRFLHHLCSLANSAILSKLTVSTLSEGRSDGEGEDGHPSYAKAKKKKSLTLDSHGCL